MKRLACLLILLCISSGTIGFVNGSTGTLNIEGGKELLYKIDLASEDRIKITFVTIVQASSHMYFSLVFPNSTILNVGEVDKYSVSFTSDSEGTCELHFDNTDSSEASFVALNYEVERYILGMPQMIFMLAVIAVLLMTIVTGYLIMGKFA